MHKILTNDQSLRPKPSASLTLAEEQRLAEVASRPARKDDGRRFVVPVFRN